MGPARTANRLNGTGTAPACLKISLQFFAVAFAKLLDIDRLRQLNIVPRSIIRSLSGVLLTSLRAAPVHFPATFLTLREVLVTLRIGTINHVVGSHAAIPTGGHHRRIDGIHFYGYPVVEHVALSLEVLTAHFLTILDDTAMELVHLFESLLQQQRRGLLALDATCTIR